MQEKIRKKVKKILESTQIGVSKDFSADEKKEMFDYFERFALQAATCRNRFFRDGWHPWELRGILGCISDYARQNAAVAGFVAEAEKYDPSDPIEPICELIQEFYDALEMKSEFCAYMEGMGMSRTTTISHFNNPTQFAKWEVFGMCQLV